MFTIRPVDLTGHDRAQEVTVEMQLTLVGTALPVFGPLTEIQYVANICSKN